MFHLSIHIARTNTHTNHIFLLYIAATLTSSVGEDGRQAACLGEVVIFKCDIPDSPTLAWTLMPYIPPWGINSIVFRPVDLGKPPIERDMNITATLTSVVNHPSNALVANFSSILTVPAATELNGSIVECSGSSAGLIILSCKSFSFSILMDTEMGHPEYIRHPDLPTYVEALHSMCQMFWVRV